MQELKEFDSVAVTNPTAEDFTHNYNGEPYLVKAGETKSFAKYVAFHLAKHLSTKMVTEDEQKKATKKQLEDRTSPIHSRISQLNIYDTPERRIALYKILGNEDFVFQVIAAYPFKGFIGEMKDYEAFVASEKSKTTE